ncbi:MAG: hypothetical protein GWP15_04130, partial [Nitrospirae bacterium]|nr:hypothetical protein [Nitrospirota bacterium]
MNKENIKKIQDRILELLPKNRRSEKSALLEYSCSELSRLVASWIKESEKNIHCFILKGDDVCGTQKSHDILVVIDENNKIYVIDPTIWQFFPDEKSILIGKFNSLNASIIATEEKYGGGWKISEDLKNISR